MEIALIIILLVIICFKIYNLDKNRERKLLKLIIKLDNKQKNVENKIYNRLKNIENILIFDDIYERNEVTININDYEFIFDKLAVYYDKQKPNKKIYFTFLLAKVKFKSKKTYDYLINCLNTDNINCIDNAFLAVTRQNDHNKVVEVLDTLNKLKIKYNYKNIMFNLNHFNGDKHKLAAILLNNYSLYKKNIKKSIIQYCIKIKYDRKATIKKLYKIEINEEMKFEMIKYFAALETKTT